jgi:hypothetical protein
MGDWINLNKFPYNYCGLYLDMVLQIYSCVIEVEKISISTYIILP